MFFALKVRGNAGRRHYARSARKALHLGVEQEDREDLSLTARFFIQWVGAVFRKIVPLRWRLKIRQCQRLIETEAVSFGSQNTTPPSAFQYAAEW